VLIFGLIPAVQTSKADVSRVLKDGGWSGTGRMSARWLTTAFMVAQLGLSVVLLSYVVSDLVDDEAPVASDDIIGTDDVLTAALSLPGDRYPTPERRAEFLARLQERTRAVPGVTAAALTNTLPANGALELRLQQEPGVARHQLPSVWSVRVGPEYFQTLNVPLLRGREFTTTEPGGDAATAIVNQRFVEMFLRDRDAVGQRLTLVSANPNDAAFTTATIVGIAADIRHRYGQHDPIVYLPLSTGAPPLTALMVRSSVDTFTMTEQLREAVLALDANLPLFQIMTLDRVVHDAGWNVRVSSRLVTTLSLIVLLLSSVGLYAVTAHAVNQRSKEIGIRIAVGARPGQIRRLVLGRAGFQVMLGLFFGVLCTIAWDGMFFSGRVDKRLADPLVLGTIAALLASVTIAACVIPMRRAAQLDPITTLRQD
jgi:putative ABC transport system permease protein